MKKGLLLLSGWFFCSMSIHAQIKMDTHFHLYALMGQSNMAGRGPLTDSLKREGHPRVLVLNKEGQWVPARHPLHFDKPGMAAAGPGLAFGIAMAEADSSVRIGLIPCAVGGTGIERWQPGVYDSATNTHPYDDAVDRIRTAMQYGVVKGVIWHQGEGNSNKTSKYYLNNLAILIGRVRELAGNPRLPFVAGELGRYNPSFGVVNEELAKLPSLIPYTGLVTSEGLTDKGDHVHFDGNSAETLGYRYAEKMKSLERKQATFNKRPDQ